MDKADNTALLIIDMQQGINDLKLGNRNNPDAEANMLKLPAMWRATARPVVHVCHIRMQ